MHKFYRATTRRPRLVVMLFLLLAAVCALCQPLIAVNYDMNDYDGLKDYTGGVSDLKDGTNEFHTETADINDTIQDKIDDKIAEKTGSDVEIASFVDPRNTDVENVQFVITTPAVRVSSVQTEAVEEEESTGIREKLRNLFR